MKVVVGQGSCGVATGALKRLPQNLKSRSSEKGLNIAVRKNRLRRNLLFGADR